MKRKGLSQILYLIIAASVLMMIAMVITFTATDIIGGAGGQATDTSCNKAIEGQCLASNTDAVQIPASTCVSEGQFVQDISPYQTSSLQDPADTYQESVAPYWASCN